MSGEMMVSRVMQSILVLMILVLGGIVIVSTVVGLMEAPPAALSVAVRHYKNGIFTVGAISVIFGGLAIRLCMDKEFLGLFNISSRVGRLVASVMAVASAFLSWIIVGVAFYFASTAGGFPYSGLFMCITDGGWLELIIIVVPTILWLTPLAISNVSQRLFRGSE